MVILTGKNLGERHKDLNCKVAEFVADKKSFDDLKVEEELTDVDKLYKIDIANRYQDVDYIVEVLKSGDSLYISRALKCNWLYNDSNSHVINVENLHDNIFPFMPLKMKMKMLKTISMHVRNKDRVATFFTYFIQNEMEEIAFKFLNFSCEEFKIDVINNFNMYEETFTSYFYNNKNTHNFIGSSFAVASALFKKNLDSLLLGQYLTMRHLYTLNNEKYLDCFEEYFIDNYYQTFCTDKGFGIRMSKDIMIRHKNRVLKKPFLYIKYINKSMLAKYSTKSDVEQYLTMIMPDTATKFWDMNFCCEYKYILDLIPIGEKFEIIKQLFTTKYPGEDFEMTADFYRLECYNLMSSDQRELWALRHIDEGREVLGSGKDYIWYKFVNIDEAIKGIRKYIFITPNNFERSDIVDILVEAAKDQNDLLKVLNYYNERHLNEETNFKEKFIDKVLQVHNVFEFDIECWEALYKILRSLKVFIPGQFCSNSVYFAVSVACHILHNKDMPQALIDFIDLPINNYYFGMLLNKLGNDKSQVVFQYLLKIYVDKLKPYENKPVNRNKHKHLKKYINNIYDLINYFNKTGDDCPEFVKKINDIISPQPKRKTVRFVSAKDIFTFIKTDVSQAIDILSHFDKSNLDGWPGNGEKNSLLNNTFRKLKLYFQNDVAKEYMKFFDKSLHKLHQDKLNNNLIKMTSVVSAIFQLADENYKVGMMEKYKPLKPKDDYDDMNTLCIQQAICKFVGYSRPPIPSKNVFEYMKGDYVHYCLPIFNMYSANLLPLMLIKFINETLNMPLSVQKHGLRLTFKWFTTDDFKTLLLNTWKKSKNISLRKIIYKLVYDKIKNKGSNAEGERAQMLFEILRFFTSDLHEDDDKYIFEAIGMCTGVIPDQFKDSYLSTAWDMAIKLPPKSVNIRRQSCIIDCIIRNIRLVRRDFIYRRIIEEHVHEMLEQRKLKPPEFRELNELHERKWCLTKKYIMGYSGNEEKEQSMELMSYIFKLCLGGWHEHYNGCRIFRKFFFNFINDLQDESLQYHKQLCHVTFFEKIINMLMETLPLKEIYLPFWKLKVTTFYILSSNETPPCQVHEEFKIFDAFAIHVGNFVKKLLDKHQFYAVFLPEIAEIIVKPSIERDMREISYLCKSLANLEMKETHLLTLLILNKYKNSTSQEDLSQILAKIQSYENEEVQSYMTEIE